MAGEAGAADAERDVRGFSLKFYTEEGNWDMVGNNTPIFFVRDAYKFPDFIRTQKRHPKTNMRSPEAMFDFWAAQPESVHQVTILMSDRGIPVNPMHMNGYGCHTFSMWNEDGERFWVKFHFKTQQGHKHYTNAEAEKLIGKTRESYQEDLYNAIDAGDFPKWTLKIQVMEEEQANEVDFNPFDLTKVWPHGDFPLIEVGELEMNRNAPKLLPDGRERRLFAVECRAGHRLRPGQDAAGACLVLCRRAPLSPWHPLRGPARQRRRRTERAALSQGWRDAVLHQRFRQS